MATSTNPLQRDRVLVQARDTGDRFEAPSTNAALMLAASLRQLQPGLSDTLDTIADREAEKQRARGRRAALLAQGSTLAEAVRDGRLKPTQNPWFMEAYNKERAAITSQEAFTRLQVESTTWEERNDPEKFRQRWAKGVAAIAEGFTSRDEIAGFTPVESQFTQQTLQQNTAENVQRIISERKENVSSLAAQALMSAASANGGALSAEQALAALAPSRQMWLDTGGTIEEWHTLQVQAITSAAYGSRNSGLLDLTRAIGLDGQPVLDGPFGARAEPQPLAPTPANPFPVLATQGLPPAFALPVQGGRVTDDFGKPRGGGKYHNGIDIAVPLGTPVTSPGVGTVMEVGEDSRSGKFVRVDHGNGLVSSYSHLSDWTVAEGDQVVPGTQLGAAGQTGHATGPHVHWVVRQGGQVVNPRSAMFPQGQQRTSVEEAFQDLAAGELPPEAPQPVPDPEAPPPPQIARGPSLYDIAGTADTLEADRYRISQAQEDAITQGLRQRQAQTRVRAQAATDFLYQQHGTAILLGDYKVPQLIQELTGQGFAPQEIQEALRTLSEGTSSSATLANNRMRINEADPAEAKAIMDLALEGERSGWSPGYEQRVGEAVLQGRISRDDGRAMVTGALESSRQKRAEARTVENQAEEDRAGRDLDSYTDLNYRKADLSGLGATLYQRFTGRAPSETERNKIKRLVADAMGAWLTAHPGDFPGAYQAGRDAVASYGTRLQAMGQGPQAPDRDSSDNPRR